MAASLCAASGRKLHRLTGRLLAEILISAAATLVATLLLSSGAPQWPIGIRPAPPAKVELRVHPDPGFETFAESVALAHVGVAASSQEPVSPKKVEVRRVAEPVRGPVKRPVSVVALPLPPARPLQLDPPALTLATPVAQPLAFRILAKIGSVIPSPQPLLWGASSVRDRLSALVPRF